MQRALAFRDAESFVRSVSPLLELGAYECLWAEQGATFRSIAEKFREHDSALPSDLVPHEAANEMAQTVLAMLRERGVMRFGLVVNRTGEYPAGLRDARHPVEILYHQGWWNLVDTPSIAIVGTRKPSDDGRQDAAALVRTLVADDWTIVSGLAEGIDTVAHTEALAQHGRTIAVIGTPICDVYPRANRELQHRIAVDHLVVSQVPVYRYYQQIWKQNRAFFPERNITMSALTAATVIVEAGETSGTLIQARAALQQGRKLFILDRCFRDPMLKWPHTYAAQGAIRVRDFAQIQETLRGAHSNR